MTAPERPLTTDRQWQPGYRPGAPGALLGAAFVIVWALWISHGILQQWQHPLALTAAFLLLPPAGFVALNFINLAFAGVVEALQKLLPPLRRFQCQAIVSLIFILTTTVVAVYWLMASSHVLPKISSTLWLAALAIYPVWHLRLRRLDPGPSRTIDSRAPHA